MADSKFSLSKATKIRKDFDSKLTKEVKQVLQILAAQQSSIAPEQNTLNGTVELKALLSHLEREQAHIDLSLDDIENRFAKVFGLPFQPSAKNLTAALFNLTFARMEQSIANGSKLFDRMEADIRKRELECYTGFPNSAGAIRAQEHSLSERNEKTLKCLVTLENKFRALASILANDYKQQKNIDIQKEFRQSLLDLTEQEEMLRLELSRARVRQAWDPTSPTSTQAEQTADRIIEICLESYKCHFRVIEQTSATTLEALKHYTSINGEKIEQQLGAKAQEQMLEILVYLDNILTHEIWLRGERHYLHIEARTPSQAESSGISLDNEETRKMKRLISLEHSLTELLSVVDEYKRIRINLSVAMVEAGLLEYDRLLKESKECFAARLNERSEEDIELSTFFSRMEAPLNRITSLLKQFEKICLQDVLSSLSNTAEESCSYDELITEDRNTVRRVLSELIDAEKTLRRTGQDLLLQEQEKLILWTYRVEVARLMNDPYLELRASKRKEIYEMAVASLEPHLGAARGKITDLPAYVTEAITVVERVEQKCGLIPNKILQQNSLVSAFSLFDRILLLLENLERLIGKNKATA